jgi:hypothetical protein
MVPQQPKRFRHPIDTETTDCANERNCPRCLVCLFPIIYQGITIKELIDHITENVAAHTEPIEAAATLEIRAIAGIYSGTGSHVSFC